MRATIETITFKDSAGLQHEEYAFREPARGVPGHVIDMFCSSIRVRLYWNVFRDEIKETARKGLYLKRMARFAKHIFDEIRDVDKPFNATMLSRVDEYMGVELESEEDKKLDKTIADGEVDRTPAGGGGGGAVVRPVGLEATGNGGHSSFKGLNFKNIKHKITQKLLPQQQQQQQDTGSGGGGNGADGESISSLSSELSQSVTSDDIGGEQIDSSELMRELERQGKHGATSRLRAFTKKLTWKNLALGLYTRWRTMWWMMMSCLFAKYYLWDPALDDFIKLKRSLLMWPDLQLVKMHDLQCKPLIFFRRVMDICRILNPLMRIDFGQFNLEKMTRFKSDQ